MKSARKAILDSFASMGVKPRDLEEYLAHPIDIVSPEEIVDLRAVYKTIADGQSTWKDYVEFTKEAPAQAGPETAGVDQSLAPGNPSEHQSVKKGAKK